MDNIVALNARFYFSILSSIHILCMHLLCNYVYYIKRILSEARIHFSDLKIQHFYMIDFAVVSKAKTSIFSPSLFCVCCWCFKMFEQTYRNGWHQAQFSQSFTLDSKLACHIDTMQTMRSPNDCIHAFPLINKGYRLVIHFNGINKVTAIVSILEGRSHENGMSSDKL